MSLNWEIYYDGDQWNYRLAQDEHDTDFIGTPDEVYDYVYELDKKDEFN